jgi:hypothetical protein
MDAKPSILGPDDPLVPILERLVEIGWIRGFAHSPGRGLTLDYTELGVARMKTVWDIANDLRDKPAPKDTFGHLVTLAFLKFGTPK